MEGKWFDVMIHHVHRRVHRDHVHGRSVEVAGIAVAVVVEAAVGHTVVAAAVAVHIVVAHLVAAHWIVVAVHLDCIVVAVRLVDQIAVAVRLDYTVAAVGDPAIYVKPFCVNSTSMHLNWIFELYRGKFDEFNHKILY